MLDIWPAQEACGSQLLERIRRLDDRGRDLSAGVEPEFGEGMFDVALRGALGDYEVCCDLPVGEALGNQVGDLTLTFGQNSSGAASGFLDWFAEGEGRDAASRRPIDKPRRKIRFETTLSEGATHFRLKLVVRAVQLGIYRALGGGRFSAGAPRRP